MVTTLRSHTCIRPHFPPSHLGLPVALEPLVEAGRMDAHRAGAALQPRKLAVGGIDDTVADEAGLHTLKLLRAGGVVRTAITGR